MHKKSYIIIFLLFFSAFLVTAQQNQNPFISSGDNQQEEHKTDISIDQNLNNTGKFYNSAFMQKIKAKQKKLLNTISGFIHEYKNSTDDSKLITFMLFSFCYGLLHVLGPGHRKVFLFTYFISRPAKWRQGIFAGFITAFLHAMSALLLIGGLYAITTKTLLRRFNNLTPIIDRISYGMIILIGVFIIIHELIDLIKKKNSEQETKNNPGVALFAIASGIIPCPGAATIMIFSIAMGVPAVGIYSVLAMSMGMAIILMLIPVLAIFLRKELAPVLSKWKPETSMIIHSSLSIIGAVFLILFGLFFII